MSAQRWRFVGILLVYTIWLAALGVLAVKSARAPITARSAPITEPR